MSKAVTKKIPIMLSFANIEWLDAQPESVAKIINALIDNLRNAQCSNTTTENIYEDTNK
nr:hypothetical protein [Moritella viscosa]SHO17735.1 Valyl-tRNA synthetase-Valine--tRNA ligase [Moritella viscosa]